MAAPGADVRVTGQRNAPRSAGAIRAIGPADFDEGGAERGIKDEG